MPRTTDMAWVLLLALLSSAVSARGDEASGERVLHRFDWQQLKADGELKSGEVVTVDGQDQPVLHFVGDGMPHTWEVFTLSAPGVTRPQYALVGKIKYQDVTGDGYLEMWNYFGDEPYFSRTLAPAGGLAKISGSSDWREVTVPFHAGKGLTPDRISLKFVVPGGGEVWLSSLALQEYDEHYMHEPSGLHPGAWWDDAGGGMVGGILGSLLGCLGALVGVLAGRRAARPLVMGLMWFAVALGTGLLIAGLVALAFSQPYAVYYPLLLCGIVTTLVFGLLLPNVRHRYQMLELRKMESLDAPG